MLDALICTGAQIIEASEDNRFGWTNFCTRRHEATLLSIITKSAFERATRIRQRRRPAINHPKRTRHYAVAAAIADIVLHEHGPDFSAHDRSSGTCFKASRLLAMLANVRQKYPTKGIFRLRRGYGGQVRLRIGWQTHRSRNLVSFLAILLEKHDMSPCQRADVAGVVVRISRPREAVIRNLVPFLASDFASLTTDANRGIREESHFDVIAHVGMLPLIRTLNAFANHRLSIFPSKP